MNVDTLRLLVSKGLSAEDILEIAETMDAPKGRTAAAERQARYRARLAAGDVTSDVTRDGNERDAPALSLPPNDNNSNPPTHTHPDGDIPRARKADPFPCPDWAEPAVWSDWMDVRKAKKARNTATAHKQFLTDIARFSDDEWPPGRLLEHAVARSWAGIYDPREKARHDRQSASHDEPRNPYVRAALGESARPRAPF